MIRFQTIHGTQNYSIQHFDLNQPKCDYQLVYVLLY